MRDNDVFTQYTASRTPNAAYCIPHPHPAYCMPLSACRKPFTGWHCLPPCSAAKGESVFRVYARDTVLACIRDNIGERDVVQEGAGVLQSKVRARDGS